MAHTVSFLRFQKGDNKRIGGATALVGYKFDEGIAEKNPRRFVLTEQDAPPTDQAVPAVFDVMCAQVDWTASKFPPTSFAGECIAGPAYLRIGPTPLIFVIIHIKWDPRFLDHIQENR